MLVASVRQHMWSLGACNGDGDFVTTRSQGDRGERVASRREGQLVRRGQVARFRSASRGEHGSFAHPLWQRVTRAFPRPGAGRRRLCSALLAVVGLIAGFSIAAAAPGADQQRPASHHQENDAHHGGADDSDKGADKARSEGDDHDKGRDDSVEHRTTSDDGGVVPSAAATSLSVRSVAAAVSPPIATVVSRSGAGLSPTPSSHAPPSPAVGQSNTGSASAGTATPGGRAVGLLPPPLPVLPPLALPANPAPRIPVTPAPAGLGLPFWAATATVVVVVVVLAARVVRRTI
jgi:hypothetical protein